MKPAYLVLTEKERGASDPDGQRSTANMSDVALDSPVQLQGCMSADAEGPSKHIRQKCCSSGSACLVFESSFALFLLNLTIELPVNKLDLNLPKQEQINSAVCAKQ